MREYDHSVAYGVWVAYSYSMHRVAALGALPIYLSKFWTLCQSEEFIDNNHRDGYIEDEFNLESMPQSLKSIFSGDPHLGGHRVEISIPDNVILAENSNIAHIVSGFDAVIDTMVIESWSAYEVLQKDLVDGVKEFLKSTNSADVQKYKEINLGAVSKFPYCGAARSFRHLKLHRGGVVDGKFIKDFKDLGFNIHIGEGFPLPSNANISLNMIDGCVSCASYLLSETARFLNAIGPPDRGPQPATV
jgi:hypothetical protein